MTKTPISPEDILTGDLIRCESIHRERYDFTAMEYKADYDKHELPARYGALRYYLLERLFEPYWGMVLGDERLVSDKAVYLPGSEKDSIPWLTPQGWYGESWVKMKLAEGWVEIKESNDD